MKFEFHHGSTKDTEFSEVFLFQEPDCLPCLFLARELKPEGLMNFFQQFHAWVPRSSHRLAGAGQFPKIQENSVPSVLPW